MIELHFLTSSVKKLLCKNMTVFPVCAVFRPAHCVQRQGLFSLFPVTFPTDWCDLPPFHWIVYMQICTCRLIKPKDKLIKLSVSAFIRCQETKTLMVSITVSRGVSPVMCQATWWLKSQWTTSTWSIYSCSRDSSLLTTQVSASAAGHCAVTLWQISVVGGEARWMFATVGSCYRSKSFNQQEAEVI